MSERADPDNVAEAASRELLPEHDLRSLFESVPGLYLVLNPELTIVEVSNEYLRATMTMRAEILGRGLFDVFPDNPDDPDATGVSNLHASLRRVLEARMPDTMAVQKYDIRRPDSEGGGFEVRYWSPLNWPVLDGNGDVVYIIHRVEDVTEFIHLKQTEAEQQQRAQSLQERTHEMEMEIFQRSQELQRSNSQLREANVAIQAANAAKSEFLSRMSHELRTPMTAILGFGELLSLEGLEAEHNEWVLMMLKAGRHLLELVDDVLDISRIETGHLSLSVEPVPVGAILADTFDLVRPLARSYDVTLLEITGPVSDRYVLADRQRLRQVLINLLSNAAKYNRQNGTISVAVDTVGEGRLRIGITDSGRGLDDDAIAKLFRPFERLDAPTLGIDGVGLGLALSRKLVENMGGAIGVSSVVGSGSTFWVELPSVEPAAIDTGGGHDDEVVDIRQYSNSKCVLYVEDTVANIRLVEEIFKRRPAITLLSAMSGGLALDMARQYRPDLILLDVHLPDIGGDEVMNRLRSDEATRDIPIVILSADATSGQAQRFIAGGAQDYLTKPIGVAKLLNVADRLMDEEMIGR